MAVEGLHGKTSSHVPDTRTFVSWSRNEKIRERLEIKTIYWISMGS